MLGAFNIWGHRKYSDLLSLYIDGQVEGPQLGRLESHLATCASCQADLETLKSTVGLLRSLPSASPGRSFTLAEVPFMPRGTPPYLWGMRLATSAAAFALVFMLVGNSLGTFTREIAYDESAEGVPPMDGAEDAQPALTMESASRESAEEVPLMDGAEDAQPALTMESASRESAEEVPPMDGAEDEESVVTTDSASAESAVPQLVPTPAILTNTEEEVLPVVALEVVFGVLLVILGTLTFAATRRFRRYRAAA